MMREKDPKSHIWAGAFIILVGLAAIVRLYVTGLDWLFSWQMLLIALGVFTGLKSRCRGGAWIILIGVGTYFLLEHYFVLDANLKKIFWPVALIIFGAFIIFRPKRPRPMFPGQWQDNFWEAPKAPEPVSAPGPTPAEPVSSSTAPAGTDWSHEETLDVVAVFGAVRRNVYSKNFKGGEIVSVFGGAEINLSQASFQEKQIVIESVQIFGGAKMIIPADWVIHNEAVAVFGGIEDKRPQPTSITAPEKMLVLKGFVMFGGIEIKSY